MKISLPLETYISMLVWWSTNQKYQSLSTVFLFFHVCFLCIVLVCRRWYAQGCFGTCLYSVKLHHFNGNTSSCITIVSDIITKAVSLMPTLSAIKWASITQVPVFDCVIHSVLLAVRVCWKTNVDDKLIVRLTWYKTHRIWLISWWAAFG